MMSFDSRDICWQDIGYFIFLRYYDVLPPLLVSVCDKGAYRDDDVACVLCTNDTFKNVTGDDECLPCDNGTITLHEGSYHCGKLLKAVRPLRMNSLQYELFLGVEQ